MYLLSKYQPLEKRLYETAPKKTYQPTVSCEKKAEYGKAEEKIVDYKIEEPKYEKIQKISEKEQSIHSTFLQPERPITQFIGRVEEIKHHILTTFRLLMDSELPNNIILKVCDREELKKVHSQFSRESWNEGIQGFAVNSQIINQIFVKKNNLDLLMLAIGHEIGHVLTTNLQDQKKEEAKAFAFELAWAQTIADNDIAELKNCINIHPNPAKNGIHDVAFEMVLEKIGKGKKPLEIYEEILKEETSLANLIGKEIYKT